MPEQKTMKSQLSRWTVHGASELAADQPLVFRLFWFAWRLLRKTTIRSLFRLVLMLTAATVTAWYTYQCYQEYISMPIVTTEDFHFNTVI